MNGYRVYTAHEVAKLLKVSDKTLYRLIQSGGLPVIWVRGQIRITAQALDEYLKGGNHA